MTGITFPVKVIGIISICLLSSCVGSRHLVDGQLAYNEAVREASDKEMLLNIVRIRYHDTIEFLSINSINSTISFSLSANAGVSVGSGDNRGSATTAAGYSSTPTISFSPQRGEQFARKLTDPVSVTVIVYLSSVIRDAHQIFRLLVTRMNGLDNLEGEVDDGFVSVTRTLAGYQYAGTADIGFSEQPFLSTPPIPVDKVSTGDMLSALREGLTIREDTEHGQIVFQQSKEQPRLYVSPGASGRDAFLAQLGLSPDRREFPIELNFREYEKAGDQALVISTRSLLQSMAFLSQGVEVPPEHVSSGIVQSLWLHPSTDPARMEDVFQVEYSKEQPDNASVAVQHRGYWFYIRDNDVVSKRSFSLIAHALRFIFEANANAGPVLTLPVSG